MAENVIAGSVPMATATSILPARSDHPLEPVQIRREERAITSTRADGGDPGFARMRLAVMLGRNFLPLPVHAGGLLVINLHAVHADIALASLGIARNHAGQSDEPSGIFAASIAGLEIRSDRRLSRVMTSLQGPVLTVLGKNLPISASMGNIFTLSRKPCGDFTSMKPRMRSATSSSLSTSKRHTHAASRAELIDEDLEPGCPLRF